MFKFYKNTSKAHIVSKHAIKRFLLNSFLLYGHQKSAQSKFIGYTFLYIIVSIFCYIRNRCYHGCFPFVSLLGWLLNNDKVGDFPKSANQPNEMALTICNLISRYCCRLMRLENVANGKEISAVPV